MLIDSEHFSPWPALAGGALIGLGCALLLLANGRIAGVSGVLGQLLRANANGRGWRLAFIAGVCLAPVLWRMCAAQSFPVPRLVVDDPGQLLSFAVGGVLVGFGTRLANGCTSGHGICGLARRSRRSLLAVVVFMGTAMLVVFVGRHLLLATP